METISDLLYRITPYFPLLGWISLLTFLLSLALVPVLLARIPADYFIAEEIAPGGTKMTNIHYSLVWLLRNIAGLLLIITGVAMLVLPGQGLLTVFLGLFVADFPGKRKLEKQIVIVPAVYKSINWVREKKGVDHLIRPQP